jgi:transposase InsO family protein
MKTDAPPKEADKHGLNAAKHHSLTGHILHRNHGSHHASIWYYRIEHLSKDGAKASVGTVGNSYDDALDATANGLHNAGLIHARPAWPDTAEGEFETLKWAKWSNTLQLH